MNENVRHRTDDIAATAAPRKLSVLLLCDDDRGHAATVLDHIGALRKFSRHDIRLFNPKGMADSRFLDLDEFDVVVVHYSLIAFLDHYLAPSFRERIRKYHGLKIQFIQDEYCRVDDAAAVMGDMGIHILFTVVPEHAVPKLYGPRLPGVVMVHTLTGFVPDHLLNAETPSLRSRPIDIGYRGRTLPYWLGELAQEKVWIAQGVLARVPQHGLRCDIAWEEKDRIYGRKWVEFLSSCKATLGTESGASIADYDGSVEKKVRDYRLHHPAADFLKIRQEILLPYENNVRVNVISPRVFEAAVLRTALILFPGEYSGIVSPWEHYIPLEKDFSNMDQVVEKLRDVPFLQEMAERAHRDLVASGLYSLEAFVREFDERVSQHGKPEGKGISIRYPLSLMEGPVVATRHFAVQHLGSTPAVNFGRAFLRIWVSLKAVMTTPPLQWMLAKYWQDGSLRKEVKLGKLLEDFLKLYLAAYGKGGQKRDDLPDIEIRVSYRRDEELLLLQSTPLHGPSVASSEESKKLLSGVRSNGHSLKRIVWDHSAVSGSVECPVPFFRQIAIPLEPDGKHEFHALSALASRHPKVAWRALSELLRCKDTLRETKG
ncbi:MAG: hypothetical protein HYU64_03515 [Armatimonadetes bacterium]|nr:hypothetical protein [Armatimonadota bacterium]